MFSAKVDGFHERRDWRKDCTRSSDSLHDNADVAGCGLIHLRDVNRWVQHSLRPDVLAQEHLLIPLLGLTATRSPQRTKPIN